MRNPLADDLDFILAHTPEVWQELRGQRLFITGGTGFFGCWLLESLCWANDHLGLEINATVLSRSPEAFSLKHPHISNHPLITWLKGNVKDFTFPKGEFQYVIHAASEGHSQANQLTPFSQFETIVTGTHRVLDFAASHGTRKLLFTSSGAVYGRQPPELLHISEDYIGAPDTMLILSTYGEAKRAAEMLCRLYTAQYGFETKIARCFAFVGPFLPLDANFAIGNFIRDALNGGPIGVKGDGSPYRSYLYAADLTVWLWTILTKGQSCRPYNVGSDQDISINELAKRVREIVGTNIEIQTLQNNTSTNNIQRYVPSVEKVKSEMLLSIIYSLDLSIRKTIINIKQNNNI